MLRGSARFASGYLLFSSLGALLLYSNCSGFKALEPTREISSSCNTVQKLTESEIAELTHLAHSPESGTPMRCPGFFAVLPDNESYLASHGMSAPDLVTSDCGINGPPPSPRPRVSPSLSPLPSLQPSPFVSPQPSVTPSPGGSNKAAMTALLISKVDPVRIKNTVTQMSDGSLWETRYHRSTSKRAVPLWIKSQFEAIVSAAGRSDVEIKLFEHTNTEMPSVEVKIRGQGPRAQEFVILGGHQDSIHGANSRTAPDFRAPGADDNASGVAVLLETFRVLMQNQFRPNATVVFYTYSAEEVGLVGSQEVARSYYANNRVVTGVIQFDMTTFSNSGDRRIAMIQDYVSESLTATVTQMAQQAVGLQVEEAQCGYACSDHASWNQYDYPAVFPVELEMDAAVGRIHTLNDVSDSKLRGDYAANFAKLGLAFAVSLGID